MASQRALANIKIFIEKALSKGATLEETRIVLKDHGWPQDLIDEALQNVSTHSSRQQPLIQMQNVTKSYNKEIVLNCINLSIYPGEIFALIGVSGSGKTTLLNSIVGFVEPDEGSVNLNLEAEPTYNIEAIYQSPYGIKNIFGVSTQIPSFYHQLTVDENLDHFASLYGLKNETIQQNKNSLLKLLGIEDARHFLSGELSQGMQKRLDIACAMIHDPKILILDEPTSNLDPFLRDEMWTLLKEINKRGTTVIFASHFLGELEEFCDRIAVLYNHSIVAVGTPLELKKYYTNNYEIHFRILSHNYEPIIRQLEKEKKVKISSVHFEDHKAVLYTPFPQEALQSLLQLLNKHREKLLDIDVNRPTIKEIFETMLKK